MTEWVFPGDIAKIAQQIGSELMPDNAQWFNRFTVQSASSNSVYTVAQRRSDGVWGCSCRGWISHRHCKHLDDVLGRLARVESSVGFGAIAQGLLDSARMTYESR